MKKDGLIDSNLATRFLGITKNHLLQLKYTGRGPKVTKCGARNFYAQEDLQRWKDERRDRRRKA